MNMDQLIGWVGGIMYMVFAQTLEFEYQKYVKDYKGIISFPEYLIRSI